MTKIERQIGERERGKSLSKLVPNPKGQFGIGSSFTPTQGQEHVNTITTLRLGKQVDNQVATPEDANDTVREEENQAKPTADVEQNTVIPNVE